MRPLLEEAVLVSVFEVLQKGFDLVFTLDVLELIFESGLGEESAVGRRWWIRSG